MRRESLLSFIRLLLLAGLAAGFFFIIASSLPYENAASALNKLAPDGRVESFTEIRHRTLSKILLPSGVSLVALSGIALIYWKRFRVWVFEELIQAAGFCRDIREDAKIFTRQTLSAYRLRSEILLIGILTLIALVARLANLFSPMDYDEAYNYNFFASGSLWHVISDYRLPNNHVLLTVLVNILTGLFGNHLWLIRLPSLIAGTLITPAAFRLARRLYNSETAIVGAAFTALFPILIKYSILARGYAIVSLLTLLIFWLGDYVRENKNRFAWLMLIVLSALGFYTIPVMLLPFGALYVWLFLSWLSGSVASYRSKYEFLKYCFAGGVAVVALTAFLYAPILLNPSNRLLENRFIAPLGLDQYPTALWRQLQVMWVDWTSGIPGWIILLGVAGLLFSFLIHNRTRKRKISIQAAFLIWLLGFLILRRPDMETRMWTFLAAPLLIGSAGGLVGFLKVASARLGKGWMLGKIFSGVVLIYAGILAISIIPTIPQRWSQKSSVETVVLYLKDRLHQGDMISSSEDFKPLLQYYFGVYDIPLAYLSHPGNFERAFILVRSVNWSADAGDTLQAVAPRNADGLPAIDLSTARLLQQYEDLAFYEGYPHP